MHHGRRAREGGPSPKRPAGTAPAALAAPGPPRMPCRLTSLPPALPGRPMQHRSSCQRCRQGYETVCCQLWLLGAVAPLPCPACLPVSEPAPCCLYPCKGRGVAVCIDIIFHLHMPSFDCASHLLACALRAATYTGSTATSFCAFPQAASTHGMQLQLSGPHTTRAACSSCDAGKDISKVWTSSDVAHIARPPPAAVSLPLHGSHRPWQPSPLCQIIGTFEFAQQHNALLYQHAWIQLKTFLIVGCPKQRIRSGKPQLHNCS